MPDQAIERTAKSVLEQLSLGMYQGAASLREQREAMTAHLHQAQGEAQRWTMVALGLVLASGLAGVVACYTSSQTSTARLWFAIHLCLVACIALVVGVRAPILSVDAGQEVAVLGRVVLSHQTKSLLGTIHGLFDHGHWGIGVLLGLFSVAVPSTKLLVSIAGFSLSLYQTGARFTAVAHTMLHYLGKWSMTDVFVVAVMVAFLSANQSQTTQATIGVGLYYFATHALLAIIAGLVAPKLVSDTHRPAVSKP
jgi:hypothetical protein